MCCTVVTGVTGSHVRPCSNENKQTVFIGFLFVYLFVYLSVYVLNHDYNMFVENCLLMSTPLVVIHGGFGSWSKWSPCSETCGGGQILRTRICDNPTSSTGGRPCEGNFLDVGVCNSISCSG